MNDGLSPLREYEWGSVFISSIRTIFDNPEGRCKLIVDIITGRRKEIFDSPVIGIRLCGDEMLFDRGWNTSEEGIDFIKMAAEASCNYISATAGLQESPDSASPVTFSWPKGARIPRRSAELTSKPADPGMIILEALERRYKGCSLKKHCEHRKTSFSDDSLNFLDKMERSGIMGHFVRALDNRHYHGILFYYEGMGGYHLRSEFRYALSWWWPRPGPKQT